MEGRPVIIIEKVEGLATSESSLVEMLLDSAKKNPLTQQIERVLFHNSFPVDVRHNAKIDRPKLARWAMMQ